MYMGLTAYIVKMIDNQPYVVRLDTLDLSK